MSKPIEKGQVWRDKVTKREVSIWGRNHSNERWIVIWRDPANFKKTVTRHLTEEFIRHRYELNPV